MTSIKQAPSGAFQLNIKNRLLPKTLWVAFDTREQADAYGRHLDAPLAQGIVSASAAGAQQPGGGNLDGGALCGRISKKRFRSARRCQIARYRAAEPCAVRDRESQLRPGRRMDPH